MSAMRIMAPADSAPEAGALVAAGAGELYFGYVPGAWLERHSPLVSFNRRTFTEAQVTTEEEVAAMVAAASAGGATVSAAFNAAYYPGWMHADLLAAAKRLSALGVSGFIVADPGLVGSMAREGLGPISLSTLGGVMNAGAARFWERRGVARVTLPREMTVAEILALAAGAPGVSFDVFVLFGACANMESFCRWAHDDPRREWPCVKTYGPDQEADAAGREAVQKAQAGWAGLSRIWACGLCALHDLASAGNVTGLKIVGRGAPTARKLTGVRMVREALEALAAGGGRESFTALARESRRRRAGSGCHPYLCYFPEFL